jgi:hypothetical protein
MAFGQLFDGHVFNPTIGRIEYTVMNTADQEGEIAARKEENKVNG